MMGRLGTALLFGLPLRRPDRVIEAFKAMYPGGMVPFTLTHRVVARHLETV